MIAKLGKVYGTLKGSGNSPTESLAGISKLMAGGFSAEAGTQTLAMMPQIAPGREAFSLQSMLSEVEQGITKGTIGEKQGVKEGMEPREELKAIAGFLNKQMRTGKTAEQQTAILHREIGEMNVGPRVARSLQAMGRLGLAVFEQAEQKTARIGDDEVDKSIARHRKSRLGIREHTQADRALARAKIGEEEGADP